MPPPRRSTEVDRMPRPVSVEDVINTQTTNGNMWAVSDDQYFPCDAAVDSMPPGQYLIHQCDNRGFFFERKKVTTDDLIVLPDDATTGVLEAIEHFWSKKQAFVDMGYLWKRGVLLWGPPGSGKTSCVQQLSAEFTRKGGLSIYSNHPAKDALGLKTLRKIEPDRPLLVMFEDIDAIIKRHGETELLSLLDGELQIDNVVFIATTNYPELLDKRIVNRPSRFDELTYIGMPSPESRRVYLENKNTRIKDDPIEMQRWIDATAGFSVAQLKEVIIAVECLDAEFDTTIDRLKKMANPPSSEDGEKKEFGFASR